MPDQNRLKNWQNSTTSVNRVNDKVVKEFSEAVSETEKQYMGWKLKLL